MYATYRAIYVQQMQMADLVRESILIKENTLTLLNVVVCYRDPIDHVIHIVYTR